MTEDTFTIRKAAPADLPRIHEIYAAARQFMRDHGNFSQWDGEDAPERLLPGDIEAGNLYVLGFEYLCAVSLFFKYSLSQSIG